MSNELPLKLLLFLNEQQQEVNLESVHLARFIPNKDRVLRGEVEEFVWPEIPLGKIKFEKGKLNLKLQIAENMQKSPSLKGVILKSMPL
jgi:hypothetical protein